MRRINKSVSPKWLETWKADFKVNNGRTPMYEDLDDDNRRMLRESLIDEQGQICCYCMRRIGLNSSHIEHFKPRAKYPEYTLEYKNLFASCEGQNDLQIETWHCDQKKEDWFNERIPSPVTEDFEKCVKYTISGKALPYYSKDSSRYALEKDLIAHLGLNAPYLVRNRKNAIYNSEICDDVEYSNEDWADFIDYYDKMHDGKFEEYCNVFISIMMEEMRGTIQD